MTTLLDELRATRDRTPAGASRETTVREAAVWGDAISIVERWVNERGLQECRLISRGDLEACITASIGKLDVAAALRTNDLVAVTDAIWSQLVRPAEEFGNPDDIGVGVDFAASLRVVVEERNRLRDELARLAVARSELTADGLPRRVVVGANGAYWRDWDDGTYSMCPVSTDNDPIIPIAVYIPENAPDDEATPAGARDWPSVLAWWQDLARQQGIRAERAERDTDIQPVDPRLTSITEGRTMSTEYRVGWQREGRRQKFVTFKTRAAAERRRARVAGETEADLHWMCDESYGNCSGGPDGPNYSCMPPVVSGPTIEQRSVDEWEPVR